MKNIKEYQDREYMPISTLIQNLHNKISIPKIKVFKENKHIYFIKIKENQTKKAISGVSERNNFK